MVISYSRAIEDRDALVYTDLRVLCFLESVIQDLTARRLKVHLGSTRTDKIDEIVFDNEILTYCILQWLNDRFFYFNRQCCLNHFDAVYLNYAQIVIITVTNFVGISL